MTNIFDSLINELEVGIIQLSDGNILHGSGSFQILEAKLPSLAGTLPFELREIIDAFSSQSVYTTFTTRNLQLVQANSTGTLENLNTATNLVQLYFQGTQSLDQILSNLVAILESLDSSLLSPSDLETIRHDIQQVQNDRRNLQKILNKALREFGSELDELDLENLVKISNRIVGELINPPPSNLDALLTVVDGFIDHLKQAEELFKNFSRKNEDLTGKEPDEIKQLIRNWGDAVTQIESLEQKDLIIKGTLSSDADQSRPIAQSIKIHDLLELNYDYLSALVRSGDLESAGIL